MLNVGRFGRMDTRAVLVYSAARALLLLGCVALGWLAGLAGLTLIFAAFLVSGVLSWFLLRRQRLAMSRTLDSGVDRLRARLRERTAAEDAYVDALQGTGEDR